MHFMRYQCLMNPYLGIYRLGMYIPIRGFYLSWTTAYQDISQFVICKLLAPKRACDTQSKYQQVTSVSWFNDLICLLDDITNKLQCPLTHRTCHILSLSSIPVLTVSINVVFILSDYSMYTFFCKHLQQVAIGGMFNHTGHQFTLATSPMQLQLIMQCRGLALFDECG